MGIFSKLKASLTKTSTNISEGIDHIFYKKKLDKEALIELEETLIMADMGAATSATIIEKFSSEKFAEEEKPENIKERLAEIISEEIKEAEQEFKIEGAKPFVIIFVGVNGSGKTTSLGKLAMQLKKKGKVAIAACDTFRAAATGQLKTWAERSGADFISGADNQDPASVAFEAFEKARNTGIDFLLIDTAGRLQNKTALMEEHSKINRVIGKVDAAAPHLTILVLDATTGQNAKLQAQEFSKIANINSLIITKLDGSAKAGVVVDIARNFKIPIHFIGTGEGIEDLETFSAKDFARNIVGL